MTSNWFKLLHNATTLSIKGKSYRLKEKRRVGLLGNGVRPNGVAPTSLRKGLPRYS